MTDDTINIRSVQHFLYCPRRFALTELNLDWSENAFVAKANILHENVHDGSHKFSDSKKVVRSDICVFNDEPQYNLYGITDCIEFIRDSRGVEIVGLDGRYKVRIVEYKPKMPKDNTFSETDAIQVFAQKICADYVWNCNSDAFIYYADKKKRIPLPFGEKALFDKYDVLLKSLLSQMRVILESKVIPPRKKGQKCSGCSLSDICFPKSSDKSIKEYIMAMKGGKL